MNWSFDVGALRYAAATFFKYLLLARASAESGFLTPEIRKRWELPVDCETKHTADKWLEQAKRQLTRLDITYGEPGSSSGIDEVDDLVGELRTLLSFLVSPDALSDAAAQIRRGEAIDWKRFLNWGDVARIRDTLDQLPHPDAGSPESNGPVPPDGFLWNGQRYRIDGPKVWRLVAHLWRCRNHAAEFATLGGPVWRDHAAQIDSGNVGSLRRDANKFFKEHSIPCRVSIRGEWVHIVEDNGSGHASNKPTAATCSTSKKARCSKSPARRKK